MKAADATATAPAALHQRIRGEIEAKILSGEWPPGHRLPFEHELTAHYGCARMTVNKAMASLAAAGLIERRKRAGSFVARPHIQSAVLRIPDIAAEVRGRGAVYGYRLIDRRERAARKGEAAATGMPAGAPLLALACLHTAGGRPFALEDRLVNLTAVPEAGGVDFAAEPPGSWLLEHVPWTEAEHRIQALGADDETAARLALAPGTACLAVERRTWRAGETITFVRQIFPGDRFDLVARFAPSEG